MFLVGHLGRCRQRVELRRRCIERGNEVRGDIEVFVTFRRIAVSFLAYYGRATRRNTGCNVTREHHAHEMVAWRQDANGRNGMMLHHHVLPPDWFQHGRMREQGPPSWSSDWLTVPVRRLCKVTWLIAIWKMKNLASQPCQIGDPKGPYLHLSLALHEGFANQETLSRHISMVLIIAQRKKLANFSWSCKISRGASLLIGVDGVQWTCNSTRDEI